MSQNKKKKGFWDFLDDAEQELSNSGSEIAQGIYQNLKANAQQSITQGIMDAITGKGGAQPPGQPTPGQPPPAPGGGFMKQPNPNINLNQPSLRENLNWFYGGEAGRPKPFSLAADTDHFSYGDFITQLHPGEYCFFYFRVLGIGEGGSFNHALEVLLDSGQNNESGWVWSFLSGKDEIEGGCLKLNNKYSDDKYTLPSYRPDQINEIILVHDGKSVKMLLNREEVGYYINVGGASKLIKTRVVGMSVTFWS